MALKPGRVIVAGDSDISYFMNETAEPGIVVTYSGSGGAGTSFDDPDSVVMVPTGATGDNSSPAGVLGTNVVDIDLTRFHVNHHKNEVNVGGKVTVYTGGQIVTNKLKSGDTPAAGVDAYFTADGLLTTTTDSTKVGVFRSTKDSDGYVKLDIQV